MRLVAEEKNTGTLELLLTKAITDWQVVIGKFLAAFLLIFTALLLTIPYYVTVAQIAKIGVDHGAILCGYFALLLMSATYISIGLFASSITRNQIVAFLLALFIGIFFHIIFDVLSNNFTGFTGQLLHYLSLSTHYDALSRGVIDSKNLVYFLSLIFLGLILTELQLEKRNIIG
jgi:ABC-2 type transport system permease protein